MMTAKTRGSNGQPGDMATVIGLGPRTLGGEMLEHADERNSVRFCNYGCTSPVAATYVYVAQKATCSTILKILTLSDTARRDLSNGTHFAKLTTQTPTGDP